MRQLCSVVGVSLPFNFSCSCSFLWTALGSPVEICLATSQLCPVPLVPPPTPSTTTYTFFAATAATWGLQVVLTLFGHNKNFVPKVGPARRCSREWKWKASRKIEQKCCRGSSGACVEMLVWLKQPAQLSLLRVINFFVLYATFGFLSYRCFALSFGLAFFFFFLFSSLFVAAFAIISPSTFA